MRTAFFALQNAQYYYDNNGKILGTEALAHPITRLKHAEKEDKETFREGTTSY